MILNFTRFENKTLGRSKQKYFAKFCAVTSIEELKTIQRVEVDFGLRPSARLLAVFDVRPARNTYSTVKPMPSNLYNIECANGLETLSHH